MINKEVRTYAKSLFNFVKFSSTPMCKNLYYSPTLIQIIFS
jgi:hypothetical protein